MILLMLGKSGFNNPLIVNESEDHVHRRLRFTREAFLCSQLCTLHPRGLNKRSEYNKVQSITFLVTLLLDIVLFHF